MYFSLEVLPPKKIEKEGHTTRNILRTFQIKNYTSNFNDSRNEKKRPLKKKNLPCRWFFYHIHRLSGSIDIPMVQNKKNLGTLKLDDVKESSRVQG